MPTFAHSSRLLGALAALALTLGLTTAPTQTASAAPASAEAAEGSAPSRLTVNGLAAPVDIDTAPRFGWHVNTARQSAYEIRMAPVPADPAADPLWSSGKVDSGAQNDLVYDGPDLESAARYRWVVRTWDADDEPTAWSAPATFGTGPGLVWDDSDPIWAASNANWTDYTLRGKFTVLQNAAPITFRATATNRFYLWQFRADANVLRPHVNLNNAGDVDLSQFGITLQTGQQHDFAIEVVGSTMRTYIDDVLVHTFTDPNATNPSGGFGFRTGSSERALFDDIVVTGLDDETLYANDFSGPNVDFPSLALQDGQILVNTSRNELFGGTWANYTINTTLTVDEAALAMRFRIADAGNSYIWQFRGDNNRLVPHKQVNGTLDATSVIKTVNLPAGTLAIGKTVAVRIEAYGSTIRTYIDNVLVDTTVDTQHWRGGVAVRTGNTESGRLDDLRVVDSLGATLVDTTFADGDRTINCGTVTGGQLRVPRAAMCNNSGFQVDWAFLRSEFEVPDKEVRWATVYATGSDAKPARQHVYKLYLNGEFVILGPTRPMATETRYDGYDVTDLLRSGETNALAATVYTTLGQRFQTELHVEYTDGSRDVFGSGEAWTGLNGSEAFPEAGSLGTSFYRAPREFLDARAFPEGFTEVGYDDSDWAPVAVKSAIPELRSTPMDKVREQFHTPERIIEKGPGHYFIDFGRSWVGGVQYDVAEGTAGDQIDMRFGETTVDGQPETVRFQMHTGNNYQDVYTQRDGAQRFETFGLKVFRYLEIIGAPEPVTADNLRALALVYPFDRDAATLETSSENLDAVWDLSRNSIEALNVNFYVDTWTRERINYEADGYLQLMSSLYLMDDLSVGIYSMDYFKTNRTWPTEWPLYVILAVHDAWQQTGQTQQLYDYYDNLKTKLPEQWFEESTGLIRKTSGSNGCNSSTNCDIVDWPASQRDGYQFRQYNTVINALSYRTYRDMAAIATEIGEDADAAHFTARADTLRDAMNELLYDEETGRYDDGRDAAGVKTGHYALHASAFALAFGVPEESEASRVAEYVGSRGMACSVYCAPFVKNGLYAAGNGQAALDLLTSEGTWSWMNMIRLGAGATMESWDPSMKSNLTFSHPWAASPAFTIPSGLFGITSTSPGYETFRVKPQPGDLAHGITTVPTVRGRIASAFGRGPEDRLRIATQVPGNTEASISLQVPEGTETIYVNTTPHEVEPVDGYATVSGLERGCYVVTSEPTASAFNDERLLSVCDQEPDIGPRPTVDAEVSEAGLAGWFTAGAELTLSAEDGATIEYRLGEGEWVAYEGPVTLPEGETMIEYRATSANGLVGLVGSTTVQVDATVPEVAASVDEERVVTIEATDSGSGVAAIDYHLGDGEWAEYADPIELDFRATSVSYRARDVAGNMSAVSVLEVPAEAGPAVSASVSNEGLDGWFGAGAELTLSTAEDALIEYRIDEDEWSEYDAPVALPEGEFTVDFRATASSGAPGDPGSVSVKVDATVPEVSASIDDDRVVTVEATDEGGSGVSLVEYRLGEGEWLVYAEPFTVGSAAQSVGYRATDRAGNLSEVGVLEVEAAPTPGPADAPIATTAPSVAGQPVVGRVLRADPGRWDVPGVRHGFVWLRDGVPMTGVSGRTYRVRPVDLRSRISVQVTASRVGYATGVAASDATEQVRPTRSRLRVRVVPGSVRSGSVVRVRARVVVPGVATRGRVDVFYRGERVRVLQLGGKGRVAARVPVAGRGPQVIRVVYRGAPGVRRAAERVPLTVR